VKEPGREICLKDHNLGVEINMSFYLKSNPSEALGTITTRYRTDIDIEISYANGEKFRFEDCTHTKDQYSIDIIYNECISYFDSIVDLFEDIYSDIYPQICFSLNMQPPTMNESTASNIDLNKYFTPL
jgi:hypothetical protein